MSMLHIFLGSFSDLNAAFASNNEGFCRYARQSDRMDRSLKVQVLSLHLETATPWIGSEEPESSHSQ